MLVLFVGVSLSKVSCGFDFDCDKSPNNDQASRSLLSIQHWSRSNYVLEFFMVKLVALPISSMGQRFCSRMFYFHFVINAKFCYYNIGHFSNFL
jgi:hypothetical protein